VLPAFRFFDISLSSAKSVNSKLSQARSAKANSIPGYSGRSGLRGEIPRSASGTTTQPGQ